MKIFISIASYQDLLLPITINSAFTNAKFKENLRFGIIDQCKVKLDFSKAKLNSIYSNDKEVCKKSCNIGLSKRIRNCRFRKKSI